MTELANPTLSEKGPSRRCFGCRLPDQLREEIERDRFRHWATYADLVKKARLHGFLLSDSSMRRHLRHIDPTSQFEAIESAENAQDMPTVFDGLSDGKISELAVAEVAVRALIEQLRLAEKARKTTRDRAHAERLQARTLQQLAALDRALHRFEQIQQPRRELKQKFFEFVQGVVNATDKATRAFLEDYLALMHRAVNQHVADPSHPERLVGFVREFEREWPERLVSRVLLAIRPIGEEAMASLR